MNVNFTGNNYSDLKINKANTSKTKPENLKHEPPKLNNKNLGKGLDALGSYGEAIIDINKNSSFEKRCIKMASAFRKAAYNYLCAAKARQRGEISWEEFLNAEKQFREAHKNLQQEDPEAYKFIETVGMDYGKK